MKPNKKLLILSLALLTLGSCGGDQPSSSPTSSGDVSGSTGDTSSSAGGSSQGDSSDSSSQGGSSSSSDSTSSQGGSSDSSSQGGSSTDSGSGSSNSSSSSSSSTPGPSLTTIGVSFDSTGDTNVNRAYTSFTKVATVSGGTATIDGSNIFPTNDTNVKFSSSKNAGSMTITLGSGILIHNIAIRAKAYGTDAAKLAVKTSANTQGGIKSISSEDYYVYNEFASDTSSSNTITITATKRSYVSEIVLNYGGSGGGSSSGSTSSSSGSSTPDDPDIQPASGDAVVVFSTTGNKSIDTFTNSQYSVTGDQSAQIDGITGSGVNAESGVIKLGTSTANGVLTITFSDEIVVKSVSVVAKAFTNTSGKTDENVTLEVAPDASTAKSVTVNSKAQYTYNFTSDTEGSQSITFTGKKSKRVVLYNISFTFGAVKPTTWGDPSQGTAPSSKTATSYKYSDLTDWDYAAYAIDSCPTSGEPKLLIIPVWFTDSSTYITNKENVRSDIETAYLGTADQTGWHSVKSFYETESQGAVTLNGTVSEWYECGRNIEAYWNYDESSDPTSDLVSEATNWYFNNHSDDKKDYDSDGDGFLDGVMLIYAAPDYGSLKNNNMSNLWAYCYWLQPQDIENPDPSNPQPNTYFWASYDFMYDSTTAESRTGKSSYGGGDCSHCTLDAHTYIHEMGHVFGLDDYYDYGDNQYSHAGGFSMQDCNVGGHDPYSVMAYGWANPYIPTESCVIEIGAFQKTHDIVLLTPSWNSVDSPFDEYFLLELYTPTGLNAFDSANAWSGNYPKGPTSVGIRLWHVDARLVYYTSDNDNGSLSQLTSDVHDSRAKSGVEHAFSDSVGADGYSRLDDDYSLLKLIRNDKTAPVHNKNDIKAADLFGNGSSFSMVDYKSQFANGKRMNSGVNLGWKFDVAISGSGDDATATLTLYRAQ